MSNLQIYCVKDNRGMIYKSKQLYIDFEAYERVAEPHKRERGRSLNFPWQAPEALTKDGAYTIQEERNVRNAMQLCSESFDL